MVLDAPVSYLFGNFKGHFIKPHSHVLLLQVFVLDSDVVVGQHCHVLDLPLVLLADGLAETLLVFVQVVQTSFDGLDCLLVQAEMRQNDALIDIGRGY